MQYHIKNIYIYNLFENSAEYNAHTWSHVRFFKLCRASFGTFWSRLLDKDSVCKEDGNAWRSTCTRQFWSRSSDVRLFKLENAPSLRWAILLSPRNTLWRFGLEGRLGHSSISFEWRLNHCRCRSCKEEIIKRIT